MKRIQVDVQTGEVKEAFFTANEVSEIRSRAEAEAAAQKSQAMRLVEQIASDSKALEALKAALK